MADVKVSWLEADTDSAPCEVLVSFCEFDTYAAPCDVKVSFCEFDSSYQQFMASLGAAPYQPKRRRYENDEEVEEPILPGEINRIRNEFLSQSLADDLIRRAKTRKARAEEEALLLMI